MKTCIQISNSTLQAVFLLTVLVVSSVQALDTPLSISRSVNSTLLPHAPETLIFYLFASKDAIEPVHVQMIDPGQWQVDVDNWPLTQDRMIRFQAQLTDLEQTEGQMLWVEMEVDGVLVGERSPLRAADAGGISVEGLVESRSATEGGFKFPDGSIQTTAASTINSGGTVTSITAGSGLSGGTINTSGTISVAPGGINESMLANGAVTAAKVDSLEVQRRVAESCTVGSSIRFISSTGSIICQHDYDTRYTASTGLRLSVNNFSVDSTVVARKDAAAGNQAFDTSTLYLDYSNNRVGVGDTTPSEKLDVNGAVAASDYLYRTPKVYTQYIMQ